MERKIFLFIFLIVVIIAGTSLLFLIKPIGAVITAAGQWSFDETSGTVAGDSSGNARNGNLMNGPAWVSNGKINGALSFDGVDDYVYVNLPASDFINNISISIWVKTGSASQSILGFTNNLPIGWVHDKELFIDAAGKVNFRFYPQGTIQSTLSINDGNWHHIAALYALDNSIQMYIDSIPQALLSAQGQSASYGGYFTVGIQSQDYGYFNGIIDEVKIFNYALSAAEVNSIYSAGNSGGTAPPPGETTPAAKPDLDVTYIERLPRYERYNVQYSTYNNASIPVGLANTGQREPASGETATFIAHMQNRGSVNSGQFQYSWKINDAVVYSGVAPSLAAGASQTASYQWQWQNNPDFYVEFIADSNNTVSEDYEQNNSLRDKINGYSLRIQAEQEAYDNFNFFTNVVGTKSFADWIQAQIKEMNRRLTQAGAQAQVRIDEIAIEPNDTLPEGGTHASPNWNWDGSWGFERTGWTLAEIQTWVGQIQDALIHELTHQLGVIDAYNLNYDWNYAKDNEVIPICASCPNGSFCGGNVATYEICTYYNPRMAGLMRGGGIQYSPFDAGALNSTRGYRRGYFGEYLFDIPANNWLRFVRNGEPASGLSVDVYQSSLNTIRLSSKIYSGTTDSAGKIALPNRPVTAIAATATNHRLTPNPFGDIHVVGLNGILLLKISYGSAVEYKYIDISEFNLAYWNGNITNATYDINTTLTGSSVAPQSASGAASTTPSSVTTPPTQPTSTQPGSAVGSNTNSNPPSANNSGGAISGSQNQAQTLPPTSSPNQITATSSQPAIPIITSPRAEALVNQNAAEQISGAQVNSSLARAAREVVESVSDQEARNIVARQERVTLDTITAQVYDRVMSQQSSSIRGAVSVSVAISFAQFLYYGTPTTKFLGAGERGGVVNSFVAAHGRWPRNETDWQDVIKIANGRWPTQRNQSAETAATASFKRIYLREPNRSLAYDDNAVMIIAYGLRPATRNLNSEQAAIRIFRAIFKYSPKSATDWDIVRAIAYSGAKR